MTSVSYTETQPSPRSTFVSVIAWIFIVLGACATLASAVQSLLYRSLSLQNRFSSTYTGTQSPTLHAIFDHLELLMLLRLVFAILLLIGAVALLYRRDWGRKLFMAMMVVGIISAIALIFIEESFVGLVIAHQANAAQQSGEPAIPSSIIITTRVFGILIPVAVAALLAWVAYKLTTPRIKAEFHSSAA